MRNLKLILFLYLFAFIPSCMAQTVEREKAIHPGGDGEPAVIAAEIEAVKRHDKALLLVTFGSSWDAPHRTYRRMKEQFAQAFPDMDVYLSFTSGICRKRCAANGKGAFHDPEHWLQAFAKAGYRTVGVQSLHLIPGKEYHDVERTVDAFRKEPVASSGQMEIALAGPLLKTRDDVDRVAELLHARFRSEVEAGSVVVLMGHGKPEKYTVGDGNFRYTMMEESLQKMHPNYFVGTVDMEGNLVEDMIRRMQHGGHRSGRVICYPLLSVAGDHANNDMCGGEGEEAEEGSWRYELTRAGYACPLANCLIEGLADRREIVGHWIGQMRKALASLRK